MKSFNLLLLIFTIVLTACGGGGGGSSSGGNSRKAVPKAPAETVMDPWKEAGSATLAQESDANLRVLDFSDGLSVIYDGSAESGDERVCRRQLVEGQYYEVCMDLADDPYYVAPGVNSLVWHPLMFDRFATELTCFIYGRRAGRDSSPEDVDCASDVYPELGEEGFTCEAGLVNGDKALRCSDDWAVAVNGADTQTKSVCRVLLADNTGLCLGVPGLGVDDGEDLILEMQQTSWDGYRSVQDNSEQFAPGDTAPALIAQHLPAGSILEYTSADESICIVDGELGIVRILRDVVAPQVCRIEMRVTAEGFTERLLFAELPILKANAAAWRDYIRRNNYFYPGEMLEAGAVLSSDPAVVETLYQSLDESICTVDAQDGTVRAVAAGECGVRLTASAENYLDVVIERSVPVDALMEYEESITATWADFPTSAVVGVDTAALNLPTVEGVQGLSASVSYVSGECSYDESSRIISFMGTRECVLAVTISGRRNHADRVVEFRISPTTGEVPVTWAGYANNNGATYGADAPVLVEPLLKWELTGVTYAYSATGGGCRVDAQSGALTIEGADRADPLINCVVTLTVSHTDYTDTVIEQTVTIAKQTQGALSVSSASYGLLVSLRAGQTPAETQSIVNTPGGRGVGNIVYSGPADTSICTVDENTGMVTAGSSVGDCVIKATWSGDDNTTFSAEATLGAIKIVAAANAAIPVWNSSPYSGDILVGANTAIVNPVTGSGTGSLEYESTTPSVCSVAPSTGAVTGMILGSCILRTRFVGDNTHAASAWVNSPAISVVQGSVLPIGFAPYGASAQVKVGASLNPESDLSAQFGIATYTIDSGTSNHCTVDNTGVVTGVEVGSCTVRAAFAGNANYSAIGEGNLQTITVVAGDQTLTFNDVYGATPSLLVGETLAVVNGPSAAAGSGAGGAITYSVKTGSETYCSVEPSDGTVTGSAPGECVIQISAAATTQYAITAADVLTIAVGTGSLTGLSWAPESGSDYDPAVGVSLLLEEVDVGTLSGVTVTYEVSDAGETGCVLESARTVSFVAPGTCLVTARASKTGYEDWSMDHSIQVVRKRIPGPDTNPGFAQDASLKVGGSAVAPGAVAWNTPPSGLDISWELVRGEDDCELVNGQTGSVRARRMAVDPNNPPLCWLRLVVQREHYRAYRGNPISIPLARGDLGTLSAPRYGTGNTLIVGGNVSMTALPVEDGGLAVEAVAFAVNGTDSSDAPKAFVCTINNDATSADFGVVTAGNSASAGDKCVVTVRVKASGYAAKDAPAVALTVGAGLTFNTAPVAAWNDGRDPVGECTLRRGEQRACSADDTGLPGTDESSTPVTVEWHYSVSGTDANGMPKEGVCTVINNPGNASHGFLRSASSGREGDICSVTAFARVSGYDDYAATPVIFTLVKGLLTEDAQGITYATLRPGGQVAPRGDSLTDDNLVAVTVSGWRVVGFDEGNDGTRDDANVCSIDGSGVVSAGSAASSGDYCSVYATSSAEGYEDQRNAFIADVLVENLGDLANTNDFTLVGPVYNGDLIIRGGGLEHGHGSENHSHYQ